MSRNHVDMSTVFARMAIVTMTFDLVNPNSRGLAKSNQYITYISSVINSS